MPGPRTTTRFSSAEKIEFAATRSSSPTVSGVRAPAAGRYGSQYDGRQSQESQQEDDRTVDRDDDRHPGHEHGAGQR